MTDPIGPIGPTGQPLASRRVRSRGVDSVNKSSATNEAPEADDVEGAQEAQAAAPIPPPGFEDAPPAVAAQVLGQEDSAEGAEDPAKVAQQAASAYLSVEWSGRYDRRTRRGRIAKTDV